MLLFIFQTHKTTALSIKKKIACFSKYCVYSCPKNSLRILLFYTMSLPVVLKIVEEEVLFTPVTYATVTLTR